MPFRRIQHLRCRIAGHEDYECRITVVGRTMEHIHACPRCGIVFLAIIQNVATPAYPYSEMSMGMGAQDQRDFLN